MVTNSLHYVEPFTNPNATSTNSFDPTPVAKAPSVRYAEVLKEHLEAIKALGLNAEVCGTWIWVSDEHDYATYEPVLKPKGFLWSSKRNAWFFAPLDPSKVFSRPQPSDRPIWPMEKIREKYGSQRIQDNRNTG